MSILSIAIDPRAAAPIRDADYDAPKTLTPLSTGSAWVVAGDAALLALWHLDARDLLHVMRSGALTARAARLQLISPWAYLIVSGDDLAGRVWLSVQGAFASVQEAGVTVIRCAAADAVPELIRLLALRTRAPKRLRPPRDVLFVEPGEDMLLAIPGVGPAVLDRLLTYCGTPGMALCALSRGDDIPSVPRTIALAAHQALGLADGVYLDPTTQEVSDATNPATVGAAAGHRR